MGFRQNTDDTLKLDNLRSLMRPCKRCGHGKGNPKGQLKGLVVVLLCLGLEGRVELVGRELWLQLRDPQGRSCGGQWVR